MAVLFGNFMTQRRKTIKSVNLLMGVLPERIVGRQGGMNRGRVGGEERCQQQGSTTWLA